MHSNEVCTTVRYHTEACESWQICCVFRPFLGLSTQIMEFKCKQAYKMIETGVLVWKSKNMKPYQPTFFYFGSNTFKTQWWIHVSYGFLYFECQIKPRVDVEWWAKSWGDRLHTLPYYIVVQSRLGSQLLKRWRTHTLSCCRQLTHISFFWLAHPNPNHLLLRYWSILSQYIGG